MTEEPTPSNRRALVGLVLMAVLFLGVWYVVSALRHSAALQDCYSSGRRDCVTIDSNGAHVNR